MCQRYIIFWLPPSFLMHQSRTFQLNRDESQRLQSLKLAYLRVIPNEHTGPYFWLNYTGLHWKCPMQPVSLSPAATQLNSHRHLWLKSGRSPMHTRLGVRAPLNVAGSLMKKACNCLASHDPFCNCCHVPFFFTACKNCSWKWQKWLKPEMNWKNPHKMYTVLQNRSYF